MRLIKIAEQKVKEQTAAIQASLKVHAVERVQARIRRHAAGPGAGQAQQAPLQQQRQDGNSLAVQGSSDLVGMSATHPLLLALDVFDTLSCDAKDA